MNWKGLFIQTSQTETPRWTQELLGSCMKFLVSVPGASGLPEARCQEMLAGSRTMLFRLWPKKTKNRSMVDFSTCVLGCRASKPLKRKNDLLGTCSVQTEEKQLLICFGDESVLKHCFMEFHGFYASWILPQPRGFIGSFCFCCGRGIQSLILWRHFVKSKQFAFFLSQEQEINESNNITHVELW